MPRDGLLLSVINDAAVVLPAFGLVTIVYLVLFFLVVSRMRALDLKLIVLGVLTGVVAAWRRVERIVDAWRGRKHSRQRRSAWTGWLDVGIWGRRGNTGPRGDIADSRRP